MNSTFILYTSAPVEPVTKRPDDILDRLFHAHGCIYGTAHGYQESIAPLLTDAFAAIDDLRSEVARLKKSLPESNQ